LYLGKLIDKNLVKNMLINFIFSFLFFSLIILSLIPSEKINLIRQVGLISSGLTFVLSFFLMVSLDQNNYYFQNLSVYQLGFEFINLYFLIGFDGISIFFFVLSSFLQKTFSTTSYLH
jgi:NADH:ubiquinone oxidoreductase subunit 4 (subunit M)